MSSDIKSERWAMSDRAYLFVVGFYIVTALYLEIELMIYGLIVFMLFEGVTGLTLTSVTQKIRKVKLDSGLLQYETSPRFNFDGFRALRIFFAVAMTAAYLGVHEYGIEMIWFLPWFFGFALLGAGVSSVCPVLLGMRWLGFK
jgi:hypothetical protein